MPNLLQSPDLGQNSDGDISDFPISGQSIINENCHNSRTSDDIDMKHGPVTKLYKRNKTTAKKFDGDVMSEICNLIVFFPIYGQFGAIRKPYSVQALIVTLYLTKTESKIKKSITKLSRYCFE